MPVTSLSLEPLNSVSRAWSITSEIQFLRWGDRCMELVEKCWLRLWLLSSYPLQFSSKNKRVTQEIKEALQLLWETGTTWINQKKRTVQNGEGPSAGRAKPSESYAYLKLSRRRCSYENNTLTQSFIQLIYLPPSSLTREKNIKCERNKTLAFNAHFNFSHTYSNCHFMATRRFESRLCQSWGLQHTNTFFFLR